MHDVGNHFQKTPGAKNMRTKMKTSHWIASAMVKSKGGGNWNKNHTEELVWFFDVCDSSGGKKGWDPFSISLKYFLQCYKHADTPPTLKAFLSNQNSGRATNHDNTEAIGGFKRAASEWFVHLGLCGT